MCRAYFLQAPHCLEPIFSASSGGQLARSLEDSVTRGQPGHNACVMPFGSILNVKAILVGKNTKFLEALQGFLLYVSSISKIIFLLNVFSSSPPIKSCSAHKNFTEGLWCAVPCIGLTKTSKTKLKTPKAQMDKTEQYQANDSREHPGRNCL